jgi:hypothetical protein
MPFNKNNVFYQDPVDIGALAPVVKTVAQAENLAAFDFEDAREIVAMLGVHEFYQTALAGANNDLDFIAKQAGVNSPVVRITFTVAGASTPLSIAVVGSDITVNVATNAGSAATSTAAQVKAAIDASAAASALVTVNLQAGNDGTGVVTALAQQTLIAPPATTIDLKLQVSFDGITWTDQFAFTQKVNAAGAETKSASALPTKGRYVLTIGGVTHIAAVSITSKYRPKA